MLAASGWYSPQGVLGALLQLVLGGSGCHVDLEELICAPGDGGCHQAGVGQVQWGLWVGGYTAF